MASSSFCRLKLRIQLQQERWDANGHNEEKSMFDKQINILKGLPEGEDGEI
jgi:hypothetical protein